ncbi:hypothetical protein Tco_0407088 [Tanacetum coccineum]
MSLALQRNNWERNGMRFLSAEAYRLQPDRRMPKLVEGNAVESAHETNVSDKGTSHTGEQSHSRLTLKVYPLSELGCSYESDANARPEASIEGRSVQLAEGRDNHEVYPKDMYPFPEVDEELVSLMGYMYKCFLRLPNGYRQIRMSEGDEEKTRFQTEEGVYCFTHVPKELKNSAATLQRMAEKVLADQNGRNVEVYLEEIVVKSRSEQSLIQDNKLRRVNVKIDPSKCTFGLEESKFLGYVMTKEGIRADLEKTQAILRSPTPRGLD